MTDQSTEPDLSPQAEAAYKADLARYHAMRDRNTRLEEGLRAANQKIVELQTGLNGKQIEISDLARRHEQELMSAKAETLRQAGIAEEAQAQRVAVETRLRSIMAIAGEPNLPHDMVETRRNLDKGLLDGVAQRLQNQANAN